MEKQRVNNKVDGYITLKKPSTESISKIALSNEELINGISKGLIDTIKPMVEINLNLAKVAAEEIIKGQKMITAMIEPITEITKEIFDMYIPILNETISNITKIFAEIDWSQFDLVFKEIVIKYLSNGFYPYRNTKVKFEEILRTGSKSKLIWIIKNGVRTDIINSEKELLIIYPEYKREIKEIYQLYERHNYRLCILSLINVISIINNTQFEYIDFLERDKIREKLLKKQIMKDKETNYLLFAPYIEDDTLSSVNVLIRSYRNNPSEYLKIPFNRNAILHGYSKKFGTEANCLRWFSVLLNTMEISKKIIKMEEKI